MIVYSDEVGYKKPSTEIFEYAFKKFQCKPETSAYIGDLIEKDIAGANKSGMFSILLRRGSNVNKEPKTELEVPLLSINNCYDFFKYVEIR